MGSQSNENRKLFGIEDYRQEQTCRFGLVVRCHCLDGGIGPRGQNVPAVEADNRQRARWTQDSLLGDVRGSILSIFSVP